MDKQQTLKAACRTLGLIHTRDTLEMILHDAEKEGSRIAAAATSATDLRSLFPKTDKGENT